jgi:hypothetical protein
MYYDIELSHTRYDDGAPCDCKEHGGNDCLMESAAVRQVVTWLQKKFGDKIPKKIGHVRSSSCFVFFFKNSRERTGLARGSSRRWGHLHTSRLRSHIVVRI